MKVCTQYSKTASPGIVRESTRSLGTWRWRLRLRHSGHLKTRERKGLSRLRKRWLAAYSKSLGIIKRTGPPSRTAATHLQRRHRTKCNKELSSYENIREDIT